jgi:hypothetical protein
LVYPYNDTSKGIFGIDSGFFGGAGRIFIPEDIIKDTSHPQVARDDLAAALQSVKDNAKGPVKK